MLTTLCGDETTRINSRAKPTSLAHDRSEDLMIFFSKYNAITF
jgi:hypothetical protein